jgi:hypothetical protein
MFVMNSLMHYYIMMGGVIHWKSWGAWAPCPLASVGCIGALNASTMKWSAMIVAYDGIKNSPCITSSEIFTFWDDINTLTLDSL